MSGAMAALGFAICVLGPKWRFLPPQARCERHKPAQPEVVEARRRLLEASVKRR